VSRVLKEVAGTLSARVLAPAEPLLSVDNVLQAAGKTVRADGRVLKVLKVARDGGELKLTVAFRSQEVPPAAPPRRIGAPIDPQTFSFPEEAGARAELLDDAGQVIPLTGVVSCARQVLLPGTGVDSGQQGAVRVDVQEVRPEDLEVGEPFELTFRARPGQQPSRLVLAVRRNVVIDVPFALRDVNLP
jgi:hypothetical protein